MVDFELPLVYFCTGLVSYLLSSSTAENLDTNSNNKNVIEHLDNVNSHLQALSRSIRSAHTDISRRRLEECQFMGPMSDTVCDLLLMDRELGTRESINDAIHGRFAPGKRAEEQNPDISKRKKTVEDLFQKEAFLEMLHKMVNDAQTSLMDERKRSCNLNLGFHCQTEHYSAIADMYNWLQSSLSPGRRKRRDTETNSRETFQQR